MAGALRAGDASHLGSRIYDTLVIAASDIEAMTGAASSPDSARQAVQLIEAVQSALNGLAALAALNSLAAPADGTCACRHPPALQLLGRGNV